VEVYPEVSAENLGGNFNALLAPLGELQSAYNWVKMPSGSKASWNAKASGRPHQLNAWVKGGRGAAGRNLGMRNGVGPAIISLAVYDEQWWRWWANVQPRWRTEDRGRPGRFLRDAYPEPTTRNWGELRHPGPNGALNFVASLYWWGKRVVGSGGQEDRESWADAVQDVKWILRGLLTAERGGTL
jgi:hypothetical protein